jgi:hypothetical protein
MLHFELESTNPSIKASKTFGVTRSGKVIAASLLSRSINKVTGTPGAESRRFVENPGSMATIPFIGYFFKNGMTSA